MCELVIEGDVAGKLIREENCDYDDPGINSQNFLDLLARARGVVLCCVARARYTTYDRSSPFAFYFEYLFARARDILLIVRVVVLVFISNAFLLYFSVAFLLISY